jgi:NADPH:quinone reductase-like Zn-dependent oxidoreductase
VQHRQGRPGPLDRRRPRHRLHTREITDGGRRYDAILDTGGARPLPLLWRALTPRATLVVVGSETGGKRLGGIDRSARAALPSPFVPQKLVMLISTERHEDLLDLTELIEEGKVSPVVDRTFPLAEVPEVLRHLAAGGPGARS